MNNTATAPTLKTPRGSFTIRQTDKITAYAIKTHTYTGTSYRMGRLILSLYDSANGFSVRECLDGSDSNCTRLMVMAVIYYAGHGEDKDLRRVGKAVYNIYPKIVELGKAIEDASIKFSRAQQEAFRDGETKGK